MARPPVLDLYPDLTGLRGPDLQTRAATMKLQAGIAPSPKEMMRIANRVAIEEGNSAPNNAPGNDPASLMRAQLPAGGIDVNSYRGSMWRGSGSQPSTLNSQPQALMREQTADGALRSRFGPPPNERGQIDIAGTNGTRSVINPAIMEMQAAPAPGEGGPTAAAVMNDPLAAPKLGEGGGSQLSTLNSQLSTPHSNSIYRGLQGTKLDPATFVDEQIARHQHQQAQALGLQATALGITKTQDDIARTRTEDAAVGQTVMGESADPSMDYLRAGGRNPAMAGALMREAPFTPSESTLPSGTRVIKNSPKSVIPDPQQRLETAAKGKTQYPRTIDAGGRKLIEVSAGKFTDEKGSPIAWKDDSAPLTLNEFYASPSIFEKFGDYATYRAQHAKDSKALGGPAPAPAPAAAPAGKAPAAAKPTAVYNHADVQAELKRRGLAQ